MAPTRKTTISTLSNANNQSASRLMSLAPELRNRIYEFVFEDQAVTLKSKSKLNPSGRSQVPGILMTCKQTYIESLQIFFNKSVFLFTSMQKLSGWMRNIGPGNRRVVGRVDFRTHHFALHHNRWPMPGAVEKSLRFKLETVEVELKRHGVMAEPGMVRIRHVSPIAHEEWIWWKGVGGEGIEGMVKSEDCYAIRE